MYAEEKDMFENSSTGVWVQTDNYTYSTDYTARTPPPAMPPFPPPSVSKKRATHINRPSPRPSLLRLPRHPLPLLPLPLLPLPFQKLPLLLRAHPLQLPLPHFLLLPIALQLPLFRLFVLVDPSELGDFGLARRADFAQHFGAEVCGADEEVGQAQEVGEEWEGGGVGGGGDG